MGFSVPIERLLERFKRYVAIDTQSDEESTTYPSTKKQLNLSKLLVEELRELGATDVELDEYGYVFATIPGNIDKEVPVIGFIAHVDTSPEVSGENVKPVVHQNYTGGDIQLPGDPSQIIRFDENPALAKCINHDIITSDGTTLLGADNKAGIAEIMTAADILISNPDLKHGTIRIAFTVDEEVGRGTEHFSVEKFGCKYAYTIDGETAGELEDETFCADTVTVTIEGINVHPGYAKNKMVNGMKIGAELLEMLPKNTLSPETTEKREGYIHPHSFNGSVEKTVIKFLMRDFTVEGLKEKESFLQDAVNFLQRKYPKAKIHFSVQESYRNMKYILEQYPHVTDYAIEAIQRTGLNPIKNLIRGGTDGARLSFMGLPTPNIFTGGHNFHSKKEWISLQDMVKATETIVHLVQIWAERGDKK
ncbi:MAG: peptidase T [Calditrichia bacterium]